MSSNRHFNSPRFLEVVFLLVPLLCLFLSSASAYADSQKSVSVEVTGGGQTAYSAQQDAVRRAMQMVIKQLVIAERKIENDQIVMDRVISSMSGYVEEFRVLKETSSGSSISIKAVVTISVQPIVNFFRGNNNNNSIDVPGGSLMAEMTRDQENRDFRTKFVERLFLGYPYRAVNVRSTRIAPSTERPGLIEVDIASSLSPEFIENLRSGLKLIQCRDYECKSNFAKICFDNRSDDRRLGSGDCINIPSGSGQSNYTWGGYQVLDDATDGIYLSTIFLNNNNDRIFTSSANKCSDGLFELDFLPIASFGRVENLSHIHGNDWRSGDKALYVRSYTSRATVFFDPAKNGDSFSKVDKINFIPLIGDLNASNTDIRKLYIELLASMHNKIRSKSPSPYKVLTPSNFGIDGCYQ